MLDFPRWKVALVLGVCLLSVLLSLPTFLPRRAVERFPGWLYAKTINLGLDLRGGSHLLLEIDFDAYLREQMTNLVDEVRTRLRAEKVGYRDLAVKDGTVVFALREKGEKPVAEIVRGISPDLTVTESEGTYRIAYNDVWITQTRSQIIEQSLEIVNRRIDETGTREPIIQRQGASRILVQVPGLENPEHLKAILGKTAKMTFHLVDENASAMDTERSLASPGVRILSGDDRRGEGGSIKYAVQARVMLSGDMLVDSHTAFGDTGDPVVSFRFNAVGARKFGEITSQNVGKRFAVVLDNKVITAPVIRSAILGGSGIIEGGFTVETANDLALLLRAGALPAPLTIVEERSVGPSLGSDSIEAGKLASVVGLILVMCFMFINYGLFGLFANMALLINAFLILAMLALLQATLTLPGIAGIVLTLGMAVDTNVLIYERMREEMRLGKSPYAAVESGFKMAFGTIIDSHLTTLSAALILYYFGTGTVKGFGVTLSIGIVASLFTAVMCTRFMIITWLRRTRPKALPI